jgi:hypothetical protein
VIKLRRAILDRHAACMGEMTNAFKSLVVKPQGKEQRGRLRYGKQNNIQIDFREVSCEDVD